LRFEFLETDGQIISVDCTNEQFDVMCSEQTGLVGSAQVDAAMRQLYAQANCEILKTEAEEDGLDDDGAIEGRPRRLSCRTSESGLRMMELTSQAQAPTKTMEATDSKPKWKVNSQQGIRLGKSHHTVTILQNDEAGLVRFEFIHPVTATGMSVECTNVEFDALCAEQNGLPAEKVVSSIQHLFRKACEEISNASTAEAKVGLQDVRSMTSEQLAPLLPAALGPSALQVGLTGLEVEDALREAIERKKRAASSKASAKQTS